MTAESDNEATHQCIPASASHSDVCVKKQNKTKQKNKTKQRLQQQQQKTARPENSRINSFKVMTNEA